jgi:oligo-1,6-glucosidase
MRIPDDFTTWNVANQIEDPTSVLMFWKQMLAFRKQCEDDLVKSSAAPLGCLADVPDIRVFSTSLAEG